MSVISDTIDILNGESAAFAFLPGINYTYFYTFQAGDPGMILAQTLATIFISSTMYNILSNSRITDGEDNDEWSDSERSLGGQSLSVLLLGGVGWLISLGYSIKSLYSLFDQSSVWPEFLVAFSAGFVFLLLSDLVLVQLLPIYEPEEGVK
ncbi:hypothetical protein ABSL23_01200 (plasmid) [Halobacterium sp. NMX12-1]|uniref:Uncharacterized protein n=1 Tax=Halobacterium sp. NMX12-1 TaxID=3166650 RepID=A0AAU8C8S1_9EURY